MERREDRAQEVRAGAERGDELADAGRGGNDRVAFLATKNFRAIMRYNPSTQYAMAVATLAREIVDEAAVGRGRGRDDGGGVRRRGE